MYQYKHFRKLGRHFEQLESRDMLTAFTVTNPIDNGNINIVGSLSWALEGANIIGTTGDLPEGSVWDSVFEQPGLPSRIFFNLTGASNGVLVNGVLPVIKALRFEIDGFDTGLGDNIILDGTGASVGVGLRFDGSIVGSGYFDISNIQLQNFDTPAINVQTLGSGDDVFIDNVTVVANNAVGISIGDLPFSGGAVSITNSVISGNEGGIGIGDTSVPGSPDLVSIVGNTIYDEENFGISLGANVRNVEIRGNEIDTDGVSGITLGTGVNDVQIDNNNDIASQNAPAIAIGATVSNVQIAGNTLLAINDSPIAIASNAGNQLRFSNNAYRLDPLETVSSIVPPIDLLNDNLINFPDAGDVDSGPNGLLNSPIILEHEIYQSGGNYVVPFVTSFGSAGNYRFELYRLDLGDSQTWIPVANSTQTVAAGITHKTISVSTSSISPGDVLSMIAIGESGANINNTSEFAFPLQNEPYIFPTLAPRVWDVALRSSTWSSGDTYDYAPLVNLNVGGTLINAQTAPMPYTGPNATDGIDLIDVLFSKPVNIATSNLRVRTSNSLNPFITPTGIVPNPDGNPFTHDYRLTFANDLPSDKYLLEIDSAVNDLGGKRLDGEWNVDHGVPDDYFDDSLPPNGNFTSGNGIDSGDFKFRFAILYGDADLNGMVNSDDKVIGLDVNRDGVANAADTAIIDDIIANGVTRLPVLQIRGADFNDDEITDSQDLAIWQASYGIDDDADADGDYDSDGRDFLIWQSAVGGKSAWYTGPPGLSALTVGVAPQVMNVIVSSSMAYEPSHPAYSFDTVDGSGSQLATVPVALADTISIVFSENINISAETLIVVGLTTANVPELAEFVYDPLTFTATWRFEGWALGDNYLLYLSDSISDIDGNFLDGEWTNPASIMTTNSAVSEFPSGDGDSGGAFIFTMTLLPGDANLNGVVDGNDYSIWTSNYAADGSFWEGDFDGDGIVGTADIAILYQTYGFNLQNTFILSDLDQDGDVDDDDIEVIGYNLGMTSADWEDGDLNGDSIVDELDLDLAFAQFGIELTNVVA